MTAFHQDLRRPFSPTAVCKGFLAAGYVRALDLEVLMRLMMGAPRARALPRFLPAAPQLQPAFRLPRLALGRGHRTPPRVPHTRVTATRSPHPPHFSFLHTPLPALLSRGGTGGLATWALPLPRAGGSGRQAPPARPPLPGPVCASRSCRSRQGQRPPLRPRGSSGWCRSTALPALSAPRAPSLPVIPSHLRHGCSPSLPVGGRIPGKRCRAALGSRSRRERVAPLRRPGMRGEGAERRWGEEGASPAAARPSAGTARRRSGGGRTGGRRRAAPGKGHFGAGSRRGFGEGPGAVPAPAVGQLPLSPGLAL